MDCWLSFATQNIYFWNLIYAVTNECVLTVWNCVSTRLNLHQSLDGSVTHLGTGASFQTGSKAAGDTGKPTDEQREELEYHEQKLDFLNVKFSRLFSV